MPVFFKFFKAIPFYVLIFLFHITSIIGQSTQTVDWKKELSTLKNQNRIDMLLKLSTDFLKEDLTLTDSLTREGIILSKQMGDSLSMYRLGANLGRVYYYQYEIDKSFKWTRKCLNYFKKNQKLAFDKAKLQLFLADLHITRRAYTKAEKLLSASNSYFETNTNLLWQGEIAYSRGVMNYDKKEFKESLDYFSKALTIGEQVKNNELIAMSKTFIGKINERYGFYPEALALQLQVFPMEISNLVKAQCYSNIGKIYGFKQDWESTMKYIQMAFKLEKEIGIGDGIWKSLTNIGIVYKKQMNFGKAMFFLEQSLAIQKKADLYPGSLLGTVGNIYNEIGQHDKANEYFDEYLKLAKTNNDWEGLWGINYNLGANFFHTKKYNEALQFLLKAYKIAEEKKHLRLLGLNNEMLSQVYEKLGQQEKVKFHQEQYAIYYNSVHDTPRDEIMEALEKMHQSELQKGSINSIQQVQSPTSQPKVPLNVSNILMGLILLVLLSGFTFLYFKNQPKKVTPPIESNAFNQAKIDEYFKQLFARLDQNKIDAKSKKINDVNVNPINDMTEFLKTNLSSSDDWKSFELYFEKVHKDFFKNLKSEHPGISINELNMCALLKLNLRNKDIAQIMGISPSSVRKAQNRLSKKLEISSDEVLRDFVLKI